MVFYDFNTITARGLAEGVEIQAVPGERMTMVRFCLQEGAPVPEHSHPHEQLGVLVSGGLEMTVAGETRTLAPGAAWRIPPDVVHSARCLADDTLVLECFSPPREDLAGT